MIDTSTDTTPFETSDQTVLTNPAPKRKKTKMAKKRAAKKQAAKKKGAKKGASKPVAKKGGVKKTGTKKTSAKKTGTKAVKKGAKKAAKAAKKSAKKGAKKGGAKKGAKASTAPSNSGQTGPKIDLSKDDLNADERKVYDALRGSAPKTMGQLAEIAFKNRGRDGKVDRTVAFSRVRNALRRLVRARLVQKAGKIESTTAGGAEMKRSAYRKAA